jgi:ferrous iron transport protein A
MANSIPLTEVPCGDTVTVVEITGGKGIASRLQALGIRCGRQITKVSNTFGHGPIVVRHGQTQTAIGHGICVKILCEAPQS